MLEKFCCCCRLRSGAITAAVLDTIGIAISYAFGITVSINADEYRLNNDEENSTEFTVDAVECLVQAVIGTVVVVLLCIGIYKRIPNLILPWLIVTAIAIVVWLVLFILFAIAIRKRCALSDYNANRGIYPFILLLYVGSILFEIYLFAVVLAYYRSLKATLSKRNMVLDPTTNAGYVVMDT